MPERGRVVLNRSFMGRGLLMFGVAGFCCGQRVFPMGNADCVLRPVPAVGCSGRRPSDFFGIRMKNFVFTGFWSNFENPH